MSSEIDMSDQYDEFVSPAEVKFLIKEADEVLDVTPKLSKKMMIALVELSNYDQSERDHYYQHQRTTKEIENHPFNHFRIIKNFVQFYNLKDLIK